MRFLKRSDLKWYKGIWNVDGRSVIDEKANVVAESDILMVDPADDIPKASYFHDCPDAFDVILTANALRNGEWKQGETLSGEETWRHIPSGLRAITRNNIVSHFDDYVSAYSFYWSERYKEPVMYYAGTYLPISRAPQKRANGVQKFIPILIKLYGGCYEGSSS